MNMQISMFLCSGAGAFIGAMLGSALITRWQTARIRELEYHLELMQEAIVKIFRERRGTAGGVT